MKLKRYPQPIEILVSYLFPEFCIGCGVRDEILCVDCIKDIPPTSDPLKDIWPLYSYQNILIREALTSLKYQRHIRYAESLSPLFTNHILSVLDIFTLVDQSRIILCPIPLHPTRERERGFNQVDLLALDFKEIETEHGYHYEKNLLVKINKTNRQVTSSRKERLSNVTGSIEISPGKEVNGKTVFVLDDVVTTSATIKEARRALLKAGARAVYGIALAH